MDTQIKPEDCNDKCNIITKSIGNIPTEFCTSCISVISYTKKTLISEHKDSDLLHAIGIHEQQMVELEDILDDGYEWKEGTRKLSKLLDSQENK
ncbi:MAG: hypothetical protein IIC74_06400 [Bacteroidetes bacterium]|nr:hypothetical protein [Bacteroidota bacterium]